MYFCICNNVRTSDVRQAIYQGITSVDGLKDYLGIATNCGSCEIKANQQLEIMLHKTLQSYQSLGSGQLIPIQIAS